eukprot:TRINITY_DN50_c0_g1_i2.p2 TRINITY_DN50_c0_g1~~TRINITY_DN50_c0_g1_i2.p2  ORF type:complete len:135 (-),score=16.48 TRINITY_DN50_c0_g1_i2:240-644(-)
MQHVSSTQHQHTSIVRLNCTYNSCNIMHSFKSHHSKLPVNNSNKELPGIPRSCFLTCAVPAGGTAEEAALVELGRNTAAVDNLEVDSHMEEEAAAEEDIQLDTPEGDTRAGKNLRTCRPTSPLLRKAPNLAIQA